MTPWARAFYDLQDQITGCYSAPVHATHHEQARRISAAFPGATLLELGAGGGQFATAAALAGLDVTALDLRPQGTAHTLSLAATHGTRLRALTGDFYTADPGGPFDLVCYTDSVCSVITPEQNWCANSTPGTRVVPSPSGRVNSYFITD